MCLKYFIWNSFDITACLLEQKTELKKSVWSQKPNPKNSSAVFIYLFVCFFIWQHGYDHVQATAGMKLSYYI